MRLRRSTLTIVWVLLALGLALSGIPHPDSHRTGRPGGDDSLERWIVKLAEGRDLLLDDQARLFTGSGGESRAWNELGFRIGGIEIRRLFPRPRTELQRDRTRGEERTGHPLRDLSLYALISFPSGRGIDLPWELRRALENPDWLEAVYPEPRAEPAALPSTGESNNPDGSGGSIDERAPDFLRGQGYLGPSPNGIGALAVRRYPGGKGASVRIVDVEGDWNWEHRDLPAPFLSEGSTIPAWRNHGTAVAGQLLGRDDGHGIVGICPDAEMGAVSFLDFGVAAAIDLASSSVDPGDVILIELHAPGPAEPEGPGQYGYLPMEWWQDCFDAIQIATANGRIVVEAAGNGSQDLDHPRYLGLFGRDVRDSGAILVGAGTPFDHGAEWFTNRGSRIDMNGWGSAIVTTGYGTLWEGAGEWQWYTSGFGGTSGAAPMVAGAVACLQSMSRSLWRVDLDPGLALDLLRESGTPCLPGAGIGPRPDLVAARAALVHGIADLRGRVLDSGSSPIVSARVTVHPGGRSVRTDENGAFRLPVRAGIFGTGEDAHDDASVSVHADGFLPASFPLDLRAADYGRRDVVLTQAPRSLCRGQVSMGDGTPVGDAPVRAVLRSGDAAGRTFRTQTTAGGSYEFASVPRNAEYTVVVGPVPGRAAASCRLGLAPNAPDVVEIPEFTLTDAETFEEGEAGWSAQTPWRSGPDGSLSGAHGWSLGDPYSADLDVDLVSPALLISANSWLSFYHRYETEPGYDGGRIEILSEGVWRPLSPLEGYDVPNVAALDWGPGYSGRSDGWCVGLIDLSDWQGSVVQIRFRFASDESLSGAGWWIDDIALFTADPEPCSVPGEFPPGPSSGDTMSPAFEVHAFPNPFRRQVRMEYRPTGGGVPFPPGSPGQRVLQVFDAAGRSLRRLSLRDGTVTWDGRDDSGREVPTGVYWVAEAKGNGKEAGGAGSRDAAEPGTGTDVAAPWAGGTEAPPVKLLRIR